MNPILDEDFTEPFWIATVLNDYGFSRMIDVHVRLVALWVDFDNPIACMF